MGFITLFKENQKTDFNHLLKSWSFIVCVVPAYCSLISLQTIIVSLFLFSLSLSLSPRMNRIGTV